MPAIKAKKAGRKTQMLKPIDAVSAPAKSRGKAIQFLKPRLALPPPESSEGAICDLQPTAMLPTHESSAAASDTLEPCVSVPSAENQAGSGGEANDETAASFAPIPARLQALQRQRAVIIKSRIMQANRLQAIIAGTLGYSAGMEEKDRRAKFIEAGRLIKAIMKGDADHPFSAIVRVTMTGIEAFDGQQAIIEKLMIDLASQLPVAKWVEHENRRGFGILLLAILIGETGDLANYANPGKVWRRMGCAPFQSGGKTAMGSTWRYGKEGKLSAAEWEEYGYSPRRRSISFLIGDCLMKGNKGDYRARYDDSKAKMQANNADYPAKRCHLHGILLAAKMLMRDLWIAWRNH